MDQSHFSMQKSISSDINERSSEAPSLRQESLLRHFLWAMLMRLGDDILVADVEELQENDASEVYVKRIKTKEFLVPKEGDRRRRRTHRSDLQGETDEPDSAKRQEQDDLEAKGDFWTLGASFTVILFKEDKSFMCLKKARLSH